METKTLYLYGPPASGKSTMARRLAAEFGRMYVDLDEEIERRAGMTVRDMFSRSGEAAFRKAESEALRSVDAPIVALGGGTLLDPANRSFAESRGFVAVLDADRETVARRIAESGGVRPLGDMMEKRRAHYESFAHHAGEGDRIMLPRALRGRICAPPSKSHLHRLLIAEFLAGGALPPAEGRECEDISATRRCLASLSGRPASAVLDVGESGSTLRFLAPLAAALGVKAGFSMRGRLAQRPHIEYGELHSGLHELRGDVSSQFVTGLLFALPLLDGDSEIRLSTPLESRGYVDMTVDVLRAYGVEVRKTGCGFMVPGRQKFVSPGPVRPEGDWSGAAFWLAANALGSDIAVDGLDASSHQPDSVAAVMIDRVKAGAEVDVSGCPDLYPALAAVDFALGAGARFTGIERLRLKESDRVAAMQAVFENPRDVDPRGDHRIAMAAAVLSTAADGPTIIHDASCVAKSYPGFWDEFRMDLYAVTGWPLKKTLSPQLHNAAYAAEGRRAEMVSHPAETVEEAMRFAVSTGVKGMAVTIPHKETIIPLLDSVDGLAREIGAVNTVVFQGGRRLGFNTDEPGFAEAILAFTSLKTLEGIRAALLGAGGAAKAVRHALERLGAVVEVFHRSPLGEGFALVVNATPVDPVPDYVFRGDEMVYDLRYEPPVTPLMARAAAAGCRVSNGLSMLEAQARLQRELFFGGCGGVAPFARNRK